jgi:hypothetical protein
MRFPKLFLSLVVLAACTQAPSDKTAKESAEASPTVKPADDAVVIADQSGPDSLKGSLRAKAEGKIGSTSILVRYHSPAVRGRIVWGGLVPLDQIWVTGAHMATKVEFGENVTIAGKPVPAGTYGFFSLPGKDSWTLVLNSNWEQHLTDEYTESLDIVRVPVKAVRRETNQERLQYSIIEETPAKGRLVVRWERVEVALPIIVMP